MITFFKDTANKLNTKVQPATGQNLGRYRQALDVMAQSFFESIGTDAAEAGSTEQIIVATSHVARVGDVIKITSGALQYDIAYVQSVATNSITLSQTLASAPAIGVTFAILRPSVPLVDSFGNISVSISDTPNVNLASVGGEPFTLGQMLTTQSLSVVQASGHNFSTTIASALPAGTNTIGKLAANSGVDIGDVDVTSIAAGSNLIGDVALQPRSTATGWNTFRTISLLSTAQTIKGSAGKLGGYFAFNATTSTIYIKIYNLTSVNPASDVPVLVFPLPAGSPGNVEWANGIAFSTGIMVRCVTGVADTNTISPSANGCIFNAMYK